LKTPGGCDSVVTVTVAALPTSAGSLTLRVCPGVPATYAGVDIPVGTSREFRLSNWLGCDSLLTVTALGLSPSASSLTLKTCPGTTAPYGGQHLPIGATQAFRLTNAAGCDSVVTVTVAALPTSAEVLEVNVCPGKTYLYAGTELAAGETRDFHFKNASDCDSVVTVRVSAWPELSFGVAAVKSCATLANGSLTAKQVAGGTPPLMYSVDGLNYQPDSAFASLPPGNYTLRVRDANGCVFEKEAPVPEYGALSVELPDVVLPCGQPSVRLEPAVSGDLTGLVFTWSSGAATPTWEATEGGPVWVEVSNVCQKVRRTAAVHWGDLGDTSLVYMANAFKPIGALVENTVFKPQFAPGLTMLSYSLEVFDRWGNMVFRSQSPEAGWDGVFRDRLSDGDVYPWLLRARVLWCGREISIFKRGDVTAVR
ncbi:MAG TPA: gliding motility-associated C-terminal domain-containing protein, partial [Saprospiraceae bacterium]|nr:gliding motility-associated C-terminal domain-containing protein [Saprospiraceae bacterium]